MHKRAVYLYGLFKGKNWKMAMKAVTYASEWHEGHKRRDGSDYFEHPLMVTNYLLNLNNPLIVTEEDVVAALLHDVIEDERATAEVVKTEFGDIVFVKVNRLTKRPGETSEENCKRIAEDPGCITIKGVDRIKNISGMVIETEKNGEVDRLKRYVEDTKTHIIPMLKRGRRLHLEYSDAYTLIGEGIDNVVKIAEAFIRMAEKNQAR